MENSDETPKIQSTIYTVSKWLEAIATVDGWVRPHCSSIKRFFQRSHHNDEETSSSTISDTDTPARKNRR